MLTCSTVELLSNVHPHQRPSLLYDHIQCDGQCFLFVRSLTDDHPSNATSDRVRWNFPSRGRPHRIFQNDCGMNGRCRAAHFTYHFNRWQNQNSVGHGGRRCETERKTEIEIHGYHQERYQEEWTDGRQHYRPQGLEIGSFQGDPLTWKSLQGEKVRRWQY